MKNLLNLDGVKALSKMEQKNVFGGLHNFELEGGSSQRCDNGSACPDGEICCGPPGGAQYCQGCSCEYSHC